MFLCTLFFFSLFTNVNYGNILFQHGKDLQRAQHHRVKKEPEDKALRQATLEVSDIFNYVLVQNDDKSIYSNEYNTQFMSYSIICTCSN